MQFQNKLCLISLNKILFSLFVFYFFVNILLTFNANVNADLFSDRTFIYKLIILCNLLLKIDKISIM